MDTTRDPKSAGVTVFAPGPVVGPGSRPLSPTADSITSTVRRWMFRSLPYRRFVLDGPVPAELQRPFAWVGAGDRTQAEAILRDEFVFFGRRVGFGSLPWSVMPPGLILAETLHGFAWLNDLKAIGTEEARLRARALVIGWIGAHRRWTPLPWAPAVLGQRLASWLAAADFILAGAGGDERARFLESAGRQARHLARMAGKSGDADGFAACSGEIAAALCLGAVSLAPALQHLQQQIARQIRPDGGHCSRNPWQHLQAFRRLVDLRAALSEAGESIPPALLGAIERMAPWLRALRHGDGRLALFHGAKESDRTLIDTVLAASRIGTTAPASMPESGYERLAAGRTVLIVDVGTPPAGGHAAPLAFEMSYGRERLIVNCGAFGGDDPRWRAALRSTPAHSTLTVEEARVSNRSWLRQRALRVESLRQEADGTLWLEATHDGYQKRFGLRHRRRLYLADAGADLRGEDILEGQKNRHFQLRFHLHPDVHATPAEADGAILLRTASGAQWRFFAVGGAVSVEESVYLGSVDQPRGSRQIVVYGCTDKGGGRIKWALRLGGEA